MTLAPDQRNDLDRLLDSVVAANLLETQRERLNTLLRSGEEAQRIYLDYLGIHADLVLRAMAQPTAENLVGLLQQDVFLEGPVNVLPAFALTARLDAQPDVSQSKPRVKPLTLSLRRTRSVLFSRSALAATLLVALLIYGAFTGIAWNLRPDKLPSFAAGSSDSVAVVRDTTDVQWVSKSAASSILPGEPLKIDSGLVKLELKSGAILAVEGPAEWTIDGNNKATLRFGKLMATVSAQAIGFTIETPTATVVDLGTEFAVEADEHGATQVEVFKGKIELQTGTKTSGSSPAQQSITLTAGSARRIEPEQGGGGAVVVREIPATAKRSTRRDSPNKPRQIRVDGTLTSSEHPGWEARHLIDGSGIHGDSHDDVPYTMWMTYSGKVKHEFVLFDLSRPYRLESMKVWNFNDGRGDMHKSRGVKRASVYVATASKGNPLTNPDDWKLVAEDHEFTVSSGTADYSTPDVIPLGGVVARFIAIVVDENHGPDLLSGVPTENNHVGLSEVQFFGFDERAQQPAVKGKKVGSKNRN